MTARYEWHGTRQDARSAVRAARRALSAIWPSRRPASRSRAVQIW